MTSTRALGAVVFCAAAAAAVSGQSQSAAPGSPAFEVVSVKPNNSGGSTTRLMMPPSGAIALTNITVRRLIREAYGVDSRRQRVTLIAGGDNPLLGPVDPTMAARFDVQGKPPDGAPPGAQRLMLQTLLAERFKLRVHTESRQLPVYALTVAREGRLGPDLRQSPHDCAAYQAARQADPSVVAPRDAAGRVLCDSEYGFDTPVVMTMRSATPLGELAARLQSWGGRPVVDATGLTGSFEWRIRFTLADSSGAGPPGIFTAVEEQLGLKLVPSTAPYDVLVVDSVELPPAD